MNRPVARLLAALAAAALAVLPVTLASAATEAASSPAEIQYLLRAIEQSGCDFYRNGSWHAAAAARAHLARKYDAVQKHTPLKSADDFIEQVASRSSATGEPYRVRCSGEPVVTSGIWFRQVLARYRQAGNNAR
jgi:Family of unknown function (DUF5329)